MIWNPCYIFFPSSHWFRNFSTQNVCIIVTQEFFPNRRWNTTQGAHCTLAQTRGNIHIQMRKKRECDTKIPTERKIENLVLLLHSARMMLLMMTRITMRALFFCPSLNLTYKFTFTEFEREFFSKRLTQSHVCKNPSKLKKKRIYIQTMKHLMVDGINRESAALFRRMP